MRTVRTAAIGLTLSLALVACGPTDATPAPSAQTASGTGSPAAGVPTATPSATPAPTATPVDVVALALTRLADPTLTANVALEATTKVGSVTTKTTGSLAIEGRASHLVRDDTVSGVKVRTETLTGNSTRYAKQKGVWVEIGASTGTELIAVLRAVETMDDLGVEYRQGQSLHHLRTTDVPVLPLELGLAVKGLTDLTTTLDGWVEADGTPVAFTFASSWRAKDGTKTVNGTKSATFEFANVGGDVSVAVPTDLWIFHTSKSDGYRMAYPADWRLDTGNAKYADAYIGIEEVVFASRARRNGVSLATINRRILAELKNVTTYSGLRIVSNKAARLDGAGARRIEYRGTDGGSPVYGQAIFAARGPWWYFIGFDSFAKTSAESRALFDTFLRTFDFR